MKRVLTLLVVASLVTSPAFAYGPDKPEKVNLSEAAAEAAREVVAAESVGLELTPPPQESAGVNGGKVGLGIGLIALGAGLIWKGTDVWQDEPDRFGRTKNADSYMLYGAGATFMFFGALSTIGGMKGRGFY